MSDNKMNLSEENRKVSIKYSEDDLNLMEKRLAEDQIPEEELDTLKMQGRLINIKEFSTIDLCAGEDMYIELLIRRVNELAAKLNDLKGIETRNAGLENLLKKNYRDAKRELSTRQFSIYTVNDRESTKRESAEFTKIKKQMRQDLENILVYMQELDDVSKQKNGPCIREWIAIRLNFFLRCRERLVFDKEWKRFLE